MASPTSNYTLRRYQATDLDQVKQIFASNIREEWGSIYHDGKYIANAERYIKSVVDDSDSDLNSIEETYFSGGGYFWVLTCQQEDDCQKNDDISKEEEAATTAKEIVVGTCGLQKLSPTTAEIRRMCLASNHRRKGWGSRMLQTAIEKARSSSDSGEEEDNRMVARVEKLVVSTIEHSLDGIDFYKKRNGFVDTLEEETGLPKKVKGVHGTPISEVFMEYKL
eukprot:CAMPEP_0172312766 /NCGR_PEP_ID=MMETSP1058-20130122/18550_1 /TAXON_ID=83371 /ORGANISM="Detonula confervacea, Strain CCMP 353" /LENGTH=221 /DNA_ID=CAMNT_0013026311 /DNA_START=150 /DNA_END=815 /DNA_ORIENTATION=-